MQAKLESLSDRHKELELLMSDPAVVADQAKYQEYARAYSHLGPIVRKVDELRRVESELAQAKELLAEDDEEMVAMARQEVASLQPRIAGIHDDLKLLLEIIDPSLVRLILLFHLG